VQTIIFILFTISILKTHTRLFIKLSNYVRHFCRRIHNDRGYIQDISRVEIGISRQDSAPGAVRGEGGEFASSFRNMRFQGALPTARRERIRQDTGSRVRGGGISEADKADNRASLALPYVSRINERVCATLRVYNEKEREREREREREKERERERTRGHYWILSIPGVIKIRSQSRGT